VTLAVPNALFYRWDAMPQLKITFR